MTRRIVITVPQVRCIGCAATCDGVVRHIGPAINAPNAVEVYVQPPRPWRVLSYDPSASDRDIGASHEPPRSFGICPSCYQHGAAYGGTTVVAPIEVTP